MGERAFEVKGDGGMRRKKKHWKNKEKKLRIKKGEEKLENRREKKKRNERTREIMRKEHQKVKGNGEIGRKDKK